MAVNERLGVSPLRDTVRTHLAEGAVVAGKKHRKVPLSDVPLSVRVPGDIVKRLDALVQPLAADAVAQGFTRMSRSLVAKRALLEGLRVLEERYRPSSAPTSTAPSTARRMPSLRRARRARAHSGSGRRSCGARG